MAVGASIICTTYINQLSIHPYIAKIQVINEKCGCWLKMSGWVDRWKERLDRACKACQVPGAGCGAGCVPGGGCRVCWVPGAGCQGVPGVVPGAGYAGCRVWCRVPCAPGAVYAWCQMWCRVPEVCSVPDYVFWPGNRRVGLAGP